MIGQTISHYRILEKLGEGGMGVVYKAEDLKLKRNVALKFLGPELTRDPKAKARFLHEAEAAAALAHPNICTIYEIDDFDGQSFISMECCEGETLKGRIARGPLPITKALNITRQIAEGLAEAHGQEIVHRDLKPANIFITRNGLVKILDFGLAKLSGQTKLTQAGTTLGTVAYMSPEQARCEEMDTRTDLWSLGVVLYEMVVGRPPFQGESQAAVVTALQTSEPEPVTGQRSGVPLELERIIGKCLAKTPAERFHTAEDLAVDLRRLIRETGPSSDSGRRYSPTVPQRRWPWMLGTALLGAAVAVVAWIMLDSDADTIDAGEMALAIVEFQDLAEAEDTSRTTALAFLLNTGLIEGSPMRVVSSSLVHDIRRRRFGESRGPIERDQALEVAREASASHLLTGAIVPGEAGGNAIWQLVDAASGTSLGGERLAMQDLAPLTDDIVAGVIPLLAVQCGTEPLATTIEVASLVSSSREAYERYLTGEQFLQNYRHFDAINALEKAVALDSTFALAYFSLSRARFETRARDEFVHGPAESAWRFRNRLSVKDRLRLEAWRHHLGFRWMAARETYEEMLGRWPDDRDALASLVRLYSYFVYHASAVRVALQGRDIYPEDSYFPWMLGRALNSIGRMEEALEQSRAFVRLEPENANAWDELGLRFVQVARPDSAEFAFRRAIEVNPGFWPSMHGIALVAYCRGDLDAAVTQMEQILVRDDVLRGQRVSERTDVIYSDPLAFYLLEAGRFAEALDAFDVARGYVRGPQELARYMRERAWCLVRIGRAREALALADSLRPFEDSENYCRVASADIRLKALEALGSLDEAGIAAAQLRQLEHIWGSDARKLSDLAEAKIALAGDKYQLAQQRLEAMMEEGIPRVGLCELEWRESWIELYRRSGHLREAESALLAVLNLYAGHYLGRYRLGQVYEAMGRPDEATRQYEIFLAGWSRADEGLPQLMDARTRLLSLRTGSR